MGQDASKKRWEFANMHIAIVDDLEHFQAGDEIKGTVTLNLKAPINLYSVVMTLQGKDCSRKVFDTKNGPIVKE
jgi:hypothetical protein